jgi:hypothetical protein
VGRNPQQDHRATQLTLPVGGARPGDRRFGGGPSRPRRNAASTTGGPNSTLSGTRTSSIPSRPASGPPYPDAVPSSHQRSDCSTRSRFVLSVRVPSGVLAVATTGCTHSGYPL